MIVYVIKSTPVNKYIQRKCCPLNVSTRFENVGPNQKQTRDNTHKQDQHNARENLENLSTVFIGALIRIPNHVCVIQISGGEPNRYSCVVHDAHCWLYANEICLWLPYAWKTIEWETETVWDLYLERSLKRKGVLTQLTRDKINIKLTKSEEFNEIRRKCCLCTLTCRSRACLKRQ